ncbi:MAG: amino acid ABC transporter permease [Muricoprocola sp.]
MLGQVTMELARGLVTTSKIFIFTLLFSLPLGLIFAFCSMSKWKPLRYLMQVFIWIIRGTPLMLQLIIIFYGPGMWLGQNIWGGSEAGRLTATVVAFSINYACYFSVIFRGGIEGIPAGQREAGQVLGMTRTQIFFKITLLQMVKRVVPPMSNEIITLVKDTSLARIIAAQELTQRGYSFMKSAGLIWPLFYTGVFYLAFVGILTLLFNYIEKKLDYFR